MGDAGCDAVSKAREQILASVLLSGAGTTGSASEATPAIRRSQQAQVAPSALGEDVVLDVTTGSFGGHQAFGETRATAGEQERSKRGSRRTKLSEDGKGFRHRAARTNSYITNGLRSKVTLVTNSMVGVSN